MKRSKNLLLALGLALAFVLVGAGTPTAQAQAGLLAPIKAQWDAGRTLVTNMAEFIPEDKYDWKPTPEVRSFREQLSHLVGENYMFASLAAGEANPMPGDKIKALQTKAEITKALKESYDYGDKMWAGMTEAKAMETAKILGADSPRLRAILLQIVDNMDHYGNLVVYVRLNGMVPPRSAPKPAPAK